MGKLWKSGEIYYGPLLAPIVRPGTLITKRPTKILKPMNASLFNLLPPDIIAAIDTWIAAPKSHDQFKHVILRFKYMSNPALFTILTKYCTLYHNFKSLRWHNITKYEWVHRRIEVDPAGYWPH